MKIELKNPRTNSTFVFLLTHKKSTTKNKRAIFFANALINIVYSKEIRLNLTNKLCFIFSLGFYNML